MRSFIIYIFVSCLSLWYSNRNFVTTLGPPYLNLDDELSSSVLFTLENFSYVKTKLTYEDHLKLKRKCEISTRRTLAEPSRRQRYQKERWDYRVHTPADVNLMYNASFEGNMRRMCYIMTSTYKAAVLDLENYYPLRFFYRNIRDFEIGYLTHDIVHTYSNILELYHMMVWQYEMQNFTYAAPPPFMLHIYTNMVLYGKHLIHLCNMMAEIENKYKGAISLFNDSTTTPPPDAPDLKKVIDTVDSINVMKNITVETHKQRQRDKREKFKELFKRPKKFAINKYLGGKRQRRPLKSEWPLKYGWSIEDNWKGYSYWSGYVNYSSDEDEESHKMKFL